MAITIIIIIIIWSVGTRLVCTVLFLLLSFREANQSNPKLYSLVVVFVVADSRRMAVVNAPKSQQILSLSLSLLVSQCPLLVLLLPLIAQAQCSARLAAC